MNTEWSMALKGAIFWKKQNFAYCYEEVKFGEIVTVGLISSNINGG